ncbi:MAG: transcription termination factor NusA [bacterium]|nr:transcription termination factor NusA [bacterium]
MFNLKDITRAITQIASEKGLQPEMILSAIEASLAAAYKKEYRKRGEVIKAKFNPETGDLKFWQVKTVVDLTTVRVVEEEPTDGLEGKNLEIRDERKHIAEEDEEDLLPRYNIDRHIMIDEARKLEGKDKKEINLEDEITFPLESHDDFGRIAAQTAKQVILQQLREAEKNAILSEFENKEGEIVSGVVQRFERGNVYVDLGRAIGVMFGNEGIPGEHYKSGERLKFYVIAVQNEPRLPSIILSRAHPQFVGKLFEMEVPEISDGIVQIKAIAREPGSRTKIAVNSTEENIDPVGSCVGQRGTRVMAVNNELGNEKIDIIEWEEAPEKFVANALSPARVTYTEVSPRREIRVFVPEDQLSLAIGRGGQNVRLAAKLTGWKIDVRSQSRPEEVQSEGVSVATSEAEAPEAVTSAVPETNEGTPKPEETEAKELS